ncbi:MAG: lipopolysaccharide assembly protein LapA domain-containing protein [Nevskiales bacterium]
MLRMLRMVLVVLALLAGMMFALMNHESVTVNLLFDQFQLPLVALLIINLLLGLAIGMLIYLPRQLTLRLELERTRRKLATAETEIRNLRNLPIQDA